MVAADPQPGFATRRKLGNAEVQSLCVCVFITLNPEAVYPKGEARNPYGESPGIPAQKGSESESRGPDFHDEVLVAEQGGHS